MKMTDLMECKKCPLSKNTKLLVDIYYKMYVDFHKRVKGEETEPYTIPLAEMCKKHLDFLPKVC